MVKTKKTNHSRVVQGDIIRNVDYIEYVREDSGTIEMSKIVFPLVIVLTQDCDLAQDYKFRWSKYNRQTEDKFLLSTLVAPLYNAEHIYTGEHLSDLGMRMDTITRKKTPGTNLKQNLNPRYHYLDFARTIQIVDSVIDFKHYFTVNIQYLKHHKKTNFVCQLGVLFREDVSQRFSSYLARIGLP